MSDDQDKLITNTDREFLEVLESSIADANSVDIAVAFVTIGGLRLLQRSLEEALSRPTPAKIRLLTSNYHDFTDIASLNLLYEMSTRVSGDMRN